LGIIDLIIIIEHFQFITIVQKLVIVYNGNFTIDPLVNVPGFVVTPRGMIRQLDTGWSPVSGQGSQTIIPNTSEHVTTFMNLEHILRLM